MLLAVAFTACEKDADQPISGDPAMNAVSKAMVMPEFLSGNPDCSDLDETYDFSGMKTNVELDEDGEFYFDGAFPEGFEVSLNDGAGSISWSYEDPAGLQCIGAIAVIVKGGPNANVYRYEGPGVTGDTDLVAPVNASGSPADVSNVTLCYTLVECDNEPCYDDETAWSDGPRYTQKGNWATYTPYVAGSTVILYAGQTHDAGTVTFSAVMDGMVTITIALDNGYFLNPDTDESVKIQGYEYAPSGNPAPGQFSYKGTSLEVTVAASHFYGVHLDLLIEVDCPEEE